MRVASAVKGAQRQRTKFRSDPNHARAPRFGNGGVVVVGQTVINHVAVGTRGSYQKPWHASALCVRTVPSTALGSHLHYYALLISIRHHEQLDAGEVKVKTFMGHIINSNFNLFTQPFLFATNQTTGAYINHCRLNRCFRATEGSLNQTNNSWMDFSRN